MTDKYKKEVIDPGDKASALAHEICIDSYNNCPAVDIIPRQAGNFRGAVDFRWRPHILEMMMSGKVSETVQNDGAGGKPNFFTLISTPEVFFGLGWEVITMCADDIARSGGFSTIMFNDIQVKKVNSKNFYLIESMLRGFGEALKKSVQINITGEFAIMKYNITSIFDENRDDQIAIIWSGGSIGLSHEDKKIDGSKIGLKMPIVGFWEPGYRCNGGTFHTDVLLAKFSPMYPDQIHTSKEAKALAKKLTVPSQSYASFLSKMNGWQKDGSVVDPIVNMAGIAHITGGGVWSKFGELLPDGIGADFYNMPKPADILLEMQELSWELPPETKLRLTDLQAHGTLHGGCGMMVVCATERDARKLIDESFSYGIEASIVGKTTESSTNEITIDSRFKEGRPLSSEELKK